MPITLFCHNKVSVLKVYGQPTPPFFGESVCIILG